LQTSGILDNNIIEAFKFTTGSSLQMDLTLSQVANLRDFEFAKCNIDLKQNKWKASN